MKKNLFENKKNIFIIIFGIAAILIIFFKLFNTNKQNHVEIVSSSSRFYTVSNCVSRYINYLYLEDVDNILLILDDSYKKKNKVSKSNLFDNINKLNLPFVFEAKKMYQEVIGDDIIKYYVFGYLIEDNIDSYSYNDNQFYIIVYFNLKNMTYSVAPYDGEIFINGGN